MIAVQTMQLSDSFIAFDWEPKGKEGSQPFSTNSLLLGDRFCVLQGSANMVTPLVYRMEKGKSAPQCISKLDPANQLNTAIWAPQGKFLLEVFVRSLCAIFRWMARCLCQWDCYWKCPVRRYKWCGGEENSRNRAQFGQLRMFSLIQTTTIRSIFQGAWDPTGRYFVTASLANNRLDPSYRIYTFQGRELFRKSIDTITRFKWRPRPPVNLPEQKIREIRRNIKAISQRFEEEDRREQLKISKDQQEKRKEIMDRFSHLRSAHKQRWEQNKEERRKLRGNLLISNFQLANSL